MGLVSEEFRVLEGRESTILLVDAASAQRRGLIRVAVPSFCDTDMFGDVVVA